MTKGSKERTVPSKPGQGRDEQSFIPPRHQHLAAVGILFLGLVIYFREPIFGGKVFLAADTIASHSFDTFLSDAKNQNIFPLWNPYIFCGMPGYGSLTLGGDRSFDLSGVVLGFVTRIAGYLLHPQFGWVIVFYIVFAIGMYLLAWSKLESKVAAFITAFAATFSTYIIIWIFFSHNTKIAAIAMFPFIFYVLEQLLARFRWSLALLLVLLMHFLYLPSHVQMIFYTFLAVGGLLLYYLIRRFVKKEDWKSVVRVGAVFALASILAFAMDADKYLSVLEYNPHSIRGSNPIVQSSSDAASKTVEGGLDYEYATSWSLGVGEVMTFVVPSLYGFGNHTYRGPLTNNQPMRISTYFGPQPWTDAPQYMGIVVLALAVIGFWQNRKDPFVQYLAIMIVFSLLVAFGKEFPLVYDLMYNYFPMFNKFRVPSMILVLVQIMVPILAGYGVAFLLKKRAQPLAPAEEKRWKYVLGAIGGFFAIALVWRGFFVGVYEVLFPPQETTRRIAQVLPSHGVNPQFAGEFYKIVADLVATDFAAAFGVLTLAFVALYLYLRRSMKISTLAVLLTLAILIDLWRVNTKPMETHEKGTQEKAFTAPEYVKSIQQDSTLFRVLEFENGQPPFNNKLAYWRIQSAYGYQGAKMRRYQDLVDVVGLKNPFLWQIMNVKYVITDRPDSSRWMGLIYDNQTTKVYVNRLVLPRAFFVNRYEVADGLPLLQKMANLSFDARDVTYLAEDPKVKIDPPLPGMSATFTHYGIQDFSIDVTAAGTNLLFISEAYYPEGWKAFLGDSLSNGILVNGKEVPIYRANYHFRAAVIPPGNHTLRMTFEPRGFSLGKNLSLAINVLLLGGLIVMGVQYYRGRNRTQDTL